MPMPTFAPNRTEDRLRELDELVQQAWAEYREALRGLAGTEYEDVEHRSWGRLQRKLDDLNRERADLIEGGDSSPDHASADAAP
jgi:hypothetical protein